MKNDNKTCHYNECLQSLSCFVTQLNKWDIESDQLYECVSLNAKRWQLVVWADLASQLAGDLSRMMASLHQVADIYHKREDVEGMRTVNDLKILYERLFIVHQHGWVSRGSFTTDKLFAALFYPPRFINIS